MSPSGRVEVAPEHFIRSPLSSVADAVLHDAVSLD